MNTTMIIYYFSATGNSFKVAQDIALANSGAKLFAIHPGMAIDLSPDVERVGFVFPVYMGVLPELVKLLIASLPVTPNVFYFAITTYYTYKGVALSAVDQLLKGKGVRLNYGCAISTVGTCLMKYEVAQHKREELLRRMEQQTQTVVNEICKGVENKIPKSSSFVVRFHEKTFRFFFQDAFKKFGVEDRCIGCGLCANVCPAGNINLKDKKPLFGTTCLACHACVHWCPRNAIFLAKSRGRFPYHHPQVTSKQLIAARKVNR